MNDSSGRQQLFAIPGDGVLARQGELVLLAAIDERGLLDRLLEVLARAGENGDDGRRFAGAVGSIIENDETWGSPDSQPGPAVVAFGPAAAGLAVTVTGTAWADIITAHGAHRVMAGQPSTLLQCVVGVPVQAVRAGLETGGGKSERTDRFSRLEAGTVRAGGLSYHAALPAAAPPAAADAASTHPASTDAVADAASTDAAAVNASAPAVPAFGVGGADAVTDAGAGMPGDPAGFGGAAMGDGALSDGAPDDAARSDSALGAAMDDEALGGVARSDPGLDDDAPGGAAPDDAASGDAGLRGAPLADDLWDEPAEPPAAERFAPEPSAAELAAAESPVAAGGASELPGREQPAGELPAAERETMWPPIPDATAAESGPDAPEPAGGQADLAEPPPYPPGPQSADPLHAAVPQAGPLPGPPGAQPAPFPGAPQPPFPGAPQPPFPGAGPAPFPGAEPAPFQGAQPAPFQGAQPEPFGGPPPGSPDGPPPGPPGGPLPGSPARPMTEVAQVPGFAAAPPAPPAPPAAPAGAGPMGAAPLHEPTGAADLPVREPTGPAHLPPPGAGAPGNGAVPGANPPIVLGVFCRNGHFGDPETRNCAVCGASRRRGQAPQPGPRPPLGALVLDDNSALVLDTDAIVGRDPIQDPAVATGEARPLRIEDEEMTVSRIHARVHLEGWRVYLVDLGSPNGTRILPPGARGEQLLQPNVPVPLQGGTRIFVGTQGFRYESGPGR